MMGRPVFEPRTGRPGFGVFAMRLLAGVTRALALGAHLRYGIRSGIVAAT